MNNGKFDEWLTNEKLQQVDEWATRGLSDKQIAQNMGISKSTFYEWKKRYMEFSDALDRGKAIANKNVENALYKLTQGYTYEEITKVPIIDPLTGLPKQDDNGEDIFIIIKKVVKSIAPNFAAQQLWLKNKLPHKWAIKKEKDSDGGGGDEDL